MGAIGLALHPDFAQNHWVYVFYSEAKNDLGDPDDNRIVRFTERDGKATERTRIISNLPTGICCHNGGRIGFGHDGKLYVLAGDVNDDGRVQNMNRLHGKILRLNDDGSIPADNPIPKSQSSRSASNPFGLAFHPTTGVPYITENGEVGDEEARIVAGGNYGNPVVEGYAQKPGFIDPVWETRRWSDRAERGHLLHRHRHARVHPATSSSARTTRRHDEDAASAGRTPIRSWPMKSSTGSATSTSPTPRRLALRRRPHDDRPFGR